MLLLLLLTVSQLSAEHLQCSLNLPLFQQQ
jgi:hypothetical protein